MEDQEGHQESSQVDQQEASREEQEACQHIRGRDSLKVVGIRP